MHAGELIENVWRIMDEIRQNSNSMLFLCEVCKKSHNILMNQPLNMCYNVHMDKKENGDREIYG